MSGETSDLILASVPRITIEVWYQSATVLGLMQETVKDRHMTKPVLELMPGGIAAALEHYQAMPRPISLSWKRLRIVRLS